MLLRKRLKNMLFKVLSYADSGIFNRKPAAYDPVLAGSLRSSDKYRAMRTIIFKRIVDNVHQNLLEMQRISNHFVML